MFDRRTFLSTATAAMAAPAFAQTSKADLLGAWTARADMPFPVQEIYPALFMDGGRPLIVNAGGLAVALGRPIKNATVIYDPQTDEWTRGVNVPETRHHLALANVDGAGLFAMGGYQRKGLNIWEAQDQLWRIDNPATGTWETARPMPKPRGEAVTLTLNGKIHMIGGRTPGDANEKWNDQRDVGDHTVYDPASDRWEKRAPLPVPRNSSTGAILNGEIYIISGRTVSGGNTPSCHVYNPQEDAWREIAPLPEPIRQQAPHGQGGLAGAAYKGKVIAFGGEWFSDGGGVYADNWAYDPAADVWHALAPMARPRHGLGGVAIEGHSEIDGVYAIGGALQRGGDGVTPFVDRFTY